MATGKGPLGSSGGVCVGVQRHIPSRVVSLPKPVAPSSHRCVARHVNAGFPSGILAFSVYLDVKEGPKGLSNWKLLKNLAVFLLSRDIPRLIQADWN